MRLLGGFQVQLNGHRAKRIGARKSEALLVYLATPVGKRHSREELASLLWSEHSESGSRANLRQALTTLRKSVHLDAANPVVSVGSLIYLDTHICKTDIEEFHLAAKAKTQASLEKAVSLYSGDFVCDLNLDAPNYSSWLDAERNRLKEVYLSSLRQLLIFYETAEQHDKVVETGQELLLNDVLQEPVHRALMKSFAATGRRGAVEQQYHHCCNELLRGLGIKPQPETRQLYQTLLSQCPTYKPSQLGVDQRNNNELRGDGVESEIVATTNQYTVDDKAKNLSDVQSNAYSRIASIVNTFPKGFGIATLALVLLLGMALLVKYKNYFPMAAARPEAVSIESPFVPLSAASPEVLSQKPSIAVLPFKNFSDSALDTRFVDGLSEDLITELSQVSALLVVARRSSFSFRGQGTDRTEIARLLGADYILDGSVRKSGKVFRVSVSLIASDGHNVWAERYDQPLSQWSQFQDELTWKVVSELSIKLTQNEQARLEANRLADPVAYDTLLKGMQPFRTFTVKGNLEARHFFKRSIEIDPEYARAYANLALTYGREVVFRYSSGQNVAIKRGLEAADKADELHAGLPQTNFARAVLLLAGKQHGKSLKAARQAIYNDPSYADGYAVLANVLGYSGILSESLHAIESAKILNPVSPFGYLFVEAHAYYLLGQYERALPVLKDVLERNPSFILGRLLHAANYAMLGMQRDAEWQIAELELLAPSLSLSSERSASLYSEDAHLQLLLLGLERAGLE